MVYAVFEKLAPLCGLDADIHHQTLAEERLPELLCFSFVFSTLK